MVRFIIKCSCLQSILCITIYIPIWLDLLSRRQQPKSTSSSNLHSNMVRFIILNKAGINPLMAEFTFQYGQIYYNRDRDFFTTALPIYIPIWLDLLFVCCYMIILCDNDLHSNMVRFIIGSPSFNILVCFVIYIPIWLDLLCYRKPPPY